ncbi:M20/M25/M40 family metallo-hydrolase [Microvirga sp. VF16]|uniref:M20/M25/M40 family metallo-hydrolase n=1 Tax=Microvirga sp. VF16 TaxID=2807101 RepID=UPI001FED6738|nr:M20/M25/M40 family metallo-hydrolase [Microvirga sp. VF16]
MHSTLRKLGHALVVGTLIAGPATAQEVAPAHMETVKRIVDSPSFKAAVDALQNEHDRWISEVIKLTEIPAPPFKEQERAKAYMEMLKAHGLTDVEIDKEGNAMGVRKGTGGGPLVVVSAHLDTVFPEGTDVTVKRDGSRLAAPGISDDSAGLATLLGIVRAMNAAGIKTKSDIVFMGTVGEEGPGDLRGVRYFFTEGKYKDQAKYFFSLDGGGTPTITNCGVGSKRYRVTYKGPGGHSYQAFGLVNPMAAMAQTVVEFYKIQTPTQPKTTYAASVTGGGTSVNSIPNEVWMEFDMRSVDAKELDRLEKRFLAIVNQSLETENFARSTKQGLVSADIKLIGDRPAGRTDEKQDIVQIATAAFQANGVPPAYECASTDSNMPMSLGIPALTIPRTGKADRFHSLDEWMDTDPQSNLTVKKIVLTTVLGVAGAQ